MPPTATIKALVNAAPCVGAGRVEGWLRSDKAEAMDVGFGLLQSFNFEGDLVFQTRRSPMLSADDAGEWKRSDPVTFEVVQEMQGMCEAVNVALSHQVVNADSGHSQSSKDPKELIGAGRIEGFVATPKEEAASEGSGFVTSPLFAGPIVFHIADNPAMGWSDYEQGTRVSFTVGADELGEAKGLQMRLSISTEPIQTEEEWVPAKKRKQMQAAVLAAMNDPWRNMPTLLPKSLFSEHDSSETKVGLVQAAFEDLVANHAERYPDKELMQLLTGLVWEADSIFGTDAIGKKLLAQRMNKSPFFATSDKDIRFVGPKNKLSIMKKNPFLQAQREGKSQPAPLCWYFKVSQCEKERCPFRHDMTMEEQMFGEKDDAANICWYWTKGKCGKGVRCAFRHYYTEAEGGLGFEASCVAAAATGAFGSGAGQKKMATPVAEPQKVQDAAKVAASTHGKQAVTAAASAAAAQLGMGPGGRAASSWAPSWDQTTEWPEGAAATGQQAFRWAAGPPQQWAASALYQAYHGQYL